MPRCYLRPALCSHSLVAPFGAVLGTRYHLIGATLGAALACIIARYLASNWVVEKAHGRVKQGIKGESSRFVACCRALSAFIAVARYSGYTGLRTTA